MYKKEEEEIVRKPKKARRKMKSMGLDLGKEKRKG